ncbi:MAG: hypothetical protein K2W85_10300 [Phycisphaerales bacterium]|nr:hypothetical protein [Phycisphaerales bacterium]
MVALKLASPKELSMRFALAFIVALAMFGRIAIAQVAQFDASSNLWTLVIPERVEKRLDGSLHIVTREIRGAAKADVEVQRPRQVPVFTALPNGQLVAGCRFSGTEPIDWQPLWIEVRNGQYFMKSQKWALSGGGSFSPRGSDMIEVRSDQTDERLRLKTPGPITPRGPGFFISYNLVDSNLPVQLQSQVLLCLDRAATRFVNLLGNDSFASPITIDVVFASLSDGVAGTQNLIFETFYSDWSRALVDFAEAQNETPGEIACYNSLPLGSFVQARMTTFSSAVSNITDITIPRSIALKFASVCLGSSICTFRLDNNCFYNSAIRFHAGGRHRVRTS